MNYLNHVMQLPEKNNGKYQGVDISMMSLCVAVLTKRICERAFHSI